MGSLAHGRLDLVSEHSSGLHLDCTRDDGASWFEEEIRLDTDEAVHAEWPLITTGAGRMHVAWIERDTERPARHPPRFHHAALESVPQPGLDVVSADPPTVELDAASVTWCDDPTFQWSLDGVPVPGEVGMTFVLPMGTPGRHA